MFIVCVGGLLGGRHLGDGVLGPGEDDPTGACKVGETMGDTDPHDSENKASAIKDKAIHSVATEM